MSFSITNNYALNTTARTDLISRNISSSLAKLSSGQRINSAADDASGLAIANNLRMQAASLTQATKNAQSTVNLVQIADNALEEVDKILTTIKAKAIQAAGDGQSTETRQALQNDVNRLISSMNAISENTKYNGQSLLSGAFTNKEFQIGAFSNETVNMSITSTDSNHVGHTREEIYDGDDLVDGTITAGANELLFAQLKINGTALQQVSLSSDTHAGAAEEWGVAGSGLGEVSRVINANSDELGVRASYEVNWESDMIGDAYDGTASEDSISLTINNISIGQVDGVEVGDADGRLVNAINAKTSETGVSASVTTDGKLKLTSEDGRMIRVDTGADMSNMLGSALNAGDATSQFWGELTLIGTGAQDFTVTDSADTAIAATSTTIDNLASIVKGNGIADDDAQFGLLLSRDGAMKAMDIVDAALKGIDSIRAELGSVQQQLDSTINNLTITAANVKIAEGGIRDVDFAVESANFNKQNLLAQASTYALAQGNAVQNNILALFR